MVKTKISFPENFFHEETRNGYTVTSEMKKVWAVELDLLSELDRVCKKLELKYFLFAGTMLGAVRDQRFIPWDDDIDVIMLREEYDKLLEFGPAEFSDPYFLQTGYTDVGYFRASSQLRNSHTAGILLPDEGKRVKFNQGIFLDIYVLDGVSLDQNELKKQIDEENKLRQLYFYMYQPFSNIALYRIIKQVRSKLLMLKYKDLSKLYSQLEMTAKRFSDSDYVDVIEYRQNPDNVLLFERKWFQESIQMEFEGFSFPVPKDYDKVLSLHFGSDYMTPRQLPSDHGRTMHVLFDTDRSYLEVLKEL